MALSADVVRGGTPVTATVTLSSPAPAGGLELLVVSYDPDVITVPDTLTIPAGATSGSFTITTHPVAEEIDVTILVDFPDPDGHFLEIITRPYGSGG